MKAKQSVKQSDAGTTEKQLSLIKAPWIIAYRRMGTRVQKSLPYFKDLGVNMQRGALKISLQSYVSMMFMLSGTGWLASLAVSVVLLLFAGAVIWLAAIYAFGVSLMFGTFVFVVLYFLPALLAANRRKRMDLELPYVSSHLSILAAAGIPPTRMFRLVEGSRTTPEVASDANEIVRDVDILGNDIMTALEAERERSPSKVFADVLEGLVATIRSGGDLKNFLLDATNTIMDLRRIAAKQLIDSLGVFSETYISLMIVFPLLIIVMFSVMALIGGGLGGLSVTLLMSFVTYAIIPVCGMAVIVMLDTMLVED